MHAENTSDNRSGDSAGYLTWEVDAGSGASLFTKHAHAGPVALQQLQHEHAVLKHLEGISGVPRILDFNAQLRELVLLDLDGRPLSECGFAGKLALDTFIDTAIEVTRVLAAVHGRGVVHLDLCPRYLIVRTSEPQIVITGFGRALLPGLDPDPGREGMTVQQLAYASPEQTGRMNRRVDFHSDLYSLGVILYELATGRLPFEETDPLALIHAHLARQPAPASSLRAGVPPALSRLLQRLLSKEPEHRFQSATLLLLALEQLRPMRSPSEVSEVPTVSSPPPAERPSQQSPPPDQHAGLALLRAMVSDAANGAPARCLLISGDVGESAMAREAIALAAAHGGIATTGRFDQSLQALDRLFGLLAGGDPHSVADWRERIREALGDDLPLLTPMLPALRALVGASVTSEPSLRRTRTRLRSAVHKLLGVVARRNHPLVIVLEDIYWADASSLDFASALLSSHDVRCVLLVCTWRNAGTRANAHPHHFIRRLQAPAGTVHHIALGALMPADVQMKLEDTERSPGSEPYQVIQQLHAVRSASRTAALAIEAERDIRSSSGTIEASIDPMIGLRLIPLDAGSRALLELAACLGHEFTLRQLSIVASPGGCAKLLVRRLGRLVEMGCIEPTNLEAAAGRTTPTHFAFCHDELRLAIYRLTEPKERTRLHLHVARQLVASNDASFRIDIAAQYALAVEQVFDRQERLQAINYLQEAAVAAARAAAFETVVAFLGAAKRLRQPDAWKSDFDACFSAHQMLHRALCCLSRGAEANAEYEILKRHARDPLDLVESASMHMGALVADGQWPKAVAVAMQLLARLGLSIPDGSFEEAAQEELEHFYASLDVLPIEQLTELAPASPRIDKIGELIAQLASHSRVNDFEVTRWCVLRAFRLWAQEGYSPHFLPCVSTMPCVTIGLRQDFSAGLRAVRVAQRVADEHDLQGSEMGMVAHGFSIAASHWIQPIEETAEHGRIAHQLLAQSGHFELASMSRVMNAILCLDSSAQLDFVEDEISDALDFATRVEHPASRLAGRALLAFVQAMRGEPLSLNFGLAPAAWPLTEHDRHEESRRGPGPGAAERVPWVKAITEVYRGLAAAVFNDETALLKQAVKLAPWLPFLEGFYASVIARLVLALAVIVRIERSEPRQGLPDGDRSPVAKALHDELVGYCEWFETCAALAPKNFGHLHDLIEARRAELEGRLWDAAQRLEIAIRRSRAHDRPWHHALILEQAGRFHMQHAMETSGRALLQRAVSAYQRWGAAGKPIHLRDTYPFLALADNAREEGGTSNLIAVDADRQAILQASQALSSETDIDRLVRRIVEVIEQLSGATATGLFFNDPEAGWSLAGARRSGRPVMGLPLPAAAAEDYGFPRSVVRYALLTPHAEAIGNITGDVRFMHDHALADVDRCSVLLLPIFSKGSATALLLLENRLSARFFTGKDLDTLGLIAGTLATSIENALLYRSLEQRVALRTEQFEKASTELALRERALACTTNGVMICEVTDGSDFPITYVNAMFEKITGYSSAEAVGRDPRFLQGPDTLQSGAALLAQAIAEQRSSTVLMRNYRKDGSMFWSDVSVAPVLTADGELRHFVGVQVDVTDRMNVERSQQRRTERLNAVFDLSPDGFVVVDEDDRVSIVNPAFERMTGLQASGLIGKSLTVFEELLAARSRPLDARLKGRRHFEDELPDAPKRPAAPLAADREGLLQLSAPHPRTLIRRVRRGAVAGRETVFYFRDVTREMEIDQMKSDFLSTAAHELRTPMTSIYGFTELVLRRKLSDEHREDMLKTIHRQSGALITLINELLDLARIEARQGADFHYKVQLLLPIVEETVKAALIGSGERIIHIVAPDEPRWVNVDAEKLSNALTNLLSNSLKYSQSEIKVELLQRTHREREEIGVCVSDRGIGMSPPQLLKLFDRFFRADSSGRVPGTGLGTTLAKEIVELHDGTIAAESQLGMGTRITMWLPAMQAPAHAVPALIARLSAPVEATAPADKTEPAEPETRKRRSAITSMRLDKGRSLHARETAAPPRRKT